MTTQLLYDIVWRSSCGPENNWDVEQRPRRLRLQRGFVPLRSGVAQGQILRPFLGWKTV
jgi:hypothetical protein